MHNWLENWKIALLMGRHRANVVRSFEIGRPKCVEDEMPSIPWYGRYDDIRQEVEESQASFQERCRVLGTDPDTAIAEVWRELIARAVHESNWQEGVYLDEPRTRELTDEALDNLPVIKGPHF